ncbi:hypothetical protein QF117_14220 [Vibrio sp. YMD68]|uniref:hypothetical protein n=1 Tax=Vibrio sp. YMD68 TaxID=3042300 RepID=UPI00249C3C69|nr:hypothetical protein [Vibrio sp. YMD68]WGV99104.1 hypothetical protein QF117_14220 [Vibrio sp. YMD68]
MESKEVEYQNELQELREILGTDTQHIPRINSLIKIGSSIAGLMDPTGTGLAITVSSILSQLIDSIKEEKDQIDDEDIANRIVHLINIKHQEISKLQDKVLPLIPQTCLVANVDHWIKLEKQTRGVSSITDNGIGSFDINFSTTLANPYDYFVHINIPTEHINLTSTSLSVNLANDIPRGTVLKMYLAKMSDKAW